MQNASLQKEQENSTTENYIQQESGYLLLPVCGILNFESNGNINLVTWRPRGLNR